MKSRIGFLKSLKEVGLPYLIQNVTIYVHIDNLKMMGLLAGSIYIPLSFSIQQVQR